MCQSQKELSEHVAAKHPTFCFKCQYCSFDYKTYNARFKHELGHAAKPYICIYCQKTFLYSKQLDTHVHVHMGKNMFPCPPCGCDRNYTTKEALNTHMIVHENKEFKCDACVQTFNTNPNLAQHIQGKHPGGWRALCGVKYQWPKQKHKHEKSYKTCCKIDQKKKAHLAKIRTKIMLEKKGRKK